MGVGMRLTRGGELCLLKALEGKELVFSRIALGDGDFDYELERVFDLTSMRNWRMDLKIVGKKIVGDGTFQLTGYESNAQIVEGFAAKEHAIFCIDPDTGEEILYSYRNTGAEYDFIPAFVGNTVKNIMFSYSVIIRDATTVTATIDNNFAYVGQNEFQNHIDATHPHKNAPSHYLDVTETDFVWATDKDDSHLHKISVANLKNLLTDKAAVTTQTQIDIQSARESLGIDANITLIEDFTNPDLVDTLKLKVTSSAKGGNLLGLANADNLLAGRYYWICDGVSQELVKVTAVISNNSGLHAKLETPLVNQYDANNCYLQRTTAKIVDAVATGAIDSAELTWTPSNAFTGIPANIERLIELETYADKVQDFIISGNGKLDDAGYFTLQ